MVYLRQYTLKIFVSPISLSHLLESPSKPITLTDDNYYLLKGKDCRFVVGSCKGLLCLYGYSDESREMWLRFWNPATRTISDKLGHHPNAVLCYPRVFGYDNSMDTYKVVYLHKGARVFSLGEGARVFSLGNNVWRNIQSFPLGYYLNEGVHLRGSVNWLAIRNYIYDYGSDDDDYGGYYYDRNYITIEQFMIVALDLGTETCKEFLPPRGFIEVPCFVPSLCVLMDYICFSHLVKEARLVIWLMMDYGVEESWTQLFKNNLHLLKNIGYGWFAWEPL